MKLTFRIISFIMMMVIIFTTIVSCGITPDNITQNNKDDNSITDDEISEIVTDIIESIQKESEKQTDGENSGTTANPESTNPLFDLSFYETDIETNVYSLVKNEINLTHHTFVGKIILNDGEEILGIGFTDFSEGAINEETDKTYFAAGFISAVGYEPIPLEEFENGLEIIDMESEEDSDVSYVYTHTVESFSRHSVFLNKYVKYGVNKDGQIWFEEADYVRGKCDESLGSLFSYDTGKYVYDPDVGDYIPITGTSLSTILDYNAIEQELNRIIEEQDYNFSSAEMQSAINISYDAVINYWQSMTEEYFMGYKVSDLIAIAKELDPETCLETTPNGLTVVNIAKAPPQEPTEFVKWTVGISCGIAVVGGLALSVLGSMPQFAALKGVGGAIIGTATEVALQVILENKALSEVDYRKVAIAALAGAISAYVGIFADAVIGGIVEATYTLMDGGDLGDATDSFLLGSIAGLALGAVFNAAASGLGKLVNKIPVLKRIKTVIAQKGDDILKKILQKFGQYIDSASEAIKDLTTTKSQNLAKKYSNTFVEPVGEDFIEGLNSSKTWDIIKKNAPSPKSSNYDMYDITGTKLITKDEFFESGYNARLKLKGKALEAAQSRYGNTLTHIDYIAGWPQFPNFGEVITDVTPDRKSNFKIFDEYFAKGLRNKTITPSDEVKNYFARKGIDLANVKTSDITKMRKGSELSLTWHEIYDPIYGIKAVLVDSKLHQSISHTGGVWESKLMLETQSFINSWIVKSTSSSLPSAPNPT